MVLATEVKTLRNDLRFPVLAREARAQPRFTIPSIDALWSKSKHVVMVGLLEPVWYPPANKQISRVSEGDKAVDGNLGLGKFLGIRLTSHP